LKARLRVCLAGVTGWVGRGLAPAIAASEDLELSGVVSRSHAGRTLAEALGAPASSLPALIVRGTVAEALAAETDVFVDYTSASAVRGHVAEAIARGVSVVVGSSGLTDEDYAEIDRTARECSVGVLAAGNFALTAVLLQRFAEIAARQIPQWEIIDYASAKKPDAPSGTSRELAARLNAVRTPEIAIPVEKTVGAPEARGASLGETRAHSVRLPGYVSSIEVLFGLPGERLSIRHDSSSGAEPYIAGTLLAIRRVGGFTGLRRGLDQVMDL
jgi:4-hydroxy-tetrahydrodipicolinate reductase